MIYQIGDGNRSRQSNPSRHSASVSLQGLDKSSLTVSQAVLLTNVGLVSCDFDVSYC